MEIRMPKPEDFSRAARPQVQEVQEWLQNPATQYLVARLQQRAYRLTQGSSSEDSTVITEARMAQGVKAALEEINTIANIARQGEHDSGNN